MYNQCRLWQDGHLRAMAGAQSLLVDTSVLADNGIGVLRNRDALWSLRGVQDNNDLLPVVYTPQVFQSEGDHLLWALQELQVLTDKVGSAQSEGRVMLTQGDESLIIIEDLRISLEV